MDDGRRTTNDKLMNPFIVYWDLGASSSDDRMILKICDELLKNKIFVLYLRDISYSPNKGLFTIMKRLGKENIKVILTAGKSFLEHSNTKALRGQGLKHLHIEIYSLEQLRSVIGDVEQSIKEGCPTGISFYVSEENFRDIPSVISLCYEHAVKNIQFPIQRIDGEKVFYPDEREVKWLLNEIKKLPLEHINPVRELRPLTVCADGGFKPPSACEKGIPPTSSMAFSNGVNLRIHDPFLWELFYGKDSLGNEGCNGAHTMIYVAENFDVTPCPLLPIVLGNLQSATLKEIFQSEKRRETRRLLSSSPRECKDCKELNKCKGGCRGRAYVLYKTLDKPDPACLSASKFK